ncbi:MAG: kelch-like protein [Chloroflexi bacterium]|nr:kelch-like protein [Chloroflexota bacterium]
MQATVQEAVRKATPTPTPTPAPTPTPSWSTRAPLPEANSEFALTEWDGKIYVIGGYPSTRITVTAVQVYDSRRDHWEITTPLPQPINHGMAAAVNGKVYVIGGQTTASGNLEEAGYLDTVFEYDPSTARWTPRATMPTKRSAGAPAVIGDKIYVAGGRPPRGNDFAVYDTRANTWTVLPDVPTQRNHLVAAAIDGKIYVVGGRFGGGFNSEVTNVVEAYDPTTNTWTKKAPMPTPRGGINGIAVNGCLYVWGGEGNVNSPIGLFNELEVYNALTDTWKRLDPMPVPVHGVTGAAFISGWIHLPGGGVSQGGSSGSAIHQVYRPETKCR